MTGGKHLSFLNQLLVPTFYCTLKKKEERNDLCMSAVKGRGEKKPNVLFKMGPLI